MAVIRRAHHVSDSPDLAGPKIPSISSTLSRHAALEGLDPFEHDVAGVVVIVIVIVKVVAVNESDFERGEKYLGGLASKNGRRVRRLS